jgi:hypothetical protein
MKIQRKALMKLLAWMGLFVGVYSFIVGVVLMLRMRYPPYNDEAILSLVGELFVNMNDGKIHANDASVKAFEIVSAFVLMAKKALYVLLCGGLTLCSITFCVLCERCDSKTGGEQ